MKDYRLKIYIKRYQKTLVKPQKNFTMIISNSKMESFGYEKGKRKPLTTKGKLKSVGMLSNILGKGGLRNSGFDIPRGKVTARQAVMLNKAAEELPSASGIAKADDIELQEIAENASRSTEDLIFQIKDIQTNTDDLFKHP